MNLFVFYKLKNLINNPKVNIGKNEKAENNEESYRVSIDGCSAVFSLRREIFSSAGEFYNNIVFYDYKVTFNRNTGKTFCDGWFLHRCEKLFDSVKKRFEFNTAQIAQKKEENIKQ